MIQFLCVPLWFPCAHPPPNFALDFFSFSLFLSLSQISGYVSVLRRMNVTMSAFAADGWSWRVREGTLVATCPSKSGYSLLLPLRVVVSGDVGAMPVACLRDAENKPVSKHALWFASASASAFCFCFCFAHHQISVLALTLPSSPCPKPSSLLSLLFPPCISRHVI